MTDPIAGVLRTSDARFADLPDYPFAPHYLEVEQMRMHYVDEGPREAKPVLMLHGEPTWSYLYRSMVPVFVGAGLRAVAPDLIGFGKSDKPTSRSAYTYQRHMDWLTAWLEATDLRGITLVCQDWGSLLGLRLAAENPDRFDRIVVANGFLPTGDRDPGPAFKAWRAFSQYSPVLPIGRIVATGTKRSLSSAERRAYDAPFPSAPLATLGAATGVELVPLADADQCCGGAGIYNLLHPGVSAAVLAAKLDRIEEAHVAVVATGNPGCLMQIGAGLRRRGSHVRVVHPVDLLDAAYAAGASDARSGDPVAHADVPR